MMNNKYHDIICFEKFLQYLVMLIFKNSFYEKFFIEMLSKMFLFFNRLYLFSLKVFFSGELFFRVKNTLF